MAFSPPSVSAAGSRPQPTTGRALIKAGSKTKAAAKPAAKGVPTSGARLAAWLKDPGLRSKLADGALPADLLAKRQANAYNAAPAAPGSAYSNADLSRLLAADTRTQFGGQQQAIDQRAAEIPGWFQTYRDQVAAALDAQKARATSQVASLGQMASAELGSTGQVPGQPLDPASAARAQAAAAVRSAGITNQQAVAQNLGGVQSDYLQNLGLNSFGLQGRALGDLAQKKLALAQAIGDFTTTQHDKILSDEADQRLKDALTTAQIGSTNASASATTAATAKTKVETKKTSAEQAFFDKHGYYPGTGKPTSPGTSAQATQAAKAGYTLAQWQKMTPTQRQGALAKTKTSSTKPVKPVAGPGSLSSAAESKVVTQINKAYELLSNPTVTTLDANKNQVVKPTSAANVLAQLRAKGVDPRILNVARSLLHNSGAGVGEMGLKNAHDLGIHVSPHWKVVRKPKPSGVAASPIKGGPGAGQ